MIVGGLASLALPFLRVSFFVHPAASLFPQSTAPRKGMTVHSLTEENRRRAERAPGRSGRKTLLGLLLSVRMKDRSYLQATVANGRNGERMAGGAGGETSRERTRQIGLWDPATIRFSPSAPQSAPFLFSPPLLPGRLHPRNSLGCSRRTFFARHAICSGGDFRRDKVEIGSAHLVEQMVKCF